MSRNTRSAPASVSRRRLLRASGALAMIAAVWTADCGTKFGSTRTAVPQAEAALGSASPALTAVPSVSLPTPTAVPRPTEALVQAAFQPVATIPATETSTSLPSAPATVTPTAEPAPPPIASASPTAVPKSIVAVGEARRSYAGSAFSLATNIEVAARRIDGATLAPGGVFSFLDRIGPQTTEAGFKWGYGIMLVNGQAQTVPMMAGGICDVSTLLFQAVYKAGLAVVTRYAHSYWIAGYGTPPDGSVGLEATVDFQPVDFRFANTTNDELKISLVCAGGWMNAKLMGVHPGWKVEIAPPVVSNVVKTDRATIRRPEPSLPVGAEVFVEQAQDGFDVTRDRAVKLDGTLVDSYKYTTRYQPSHNVIIYGGPAAGTPVALTPGSGTSATTSTASPLPSTPRPSSPTAVRTPASSSTAPALGGSSIVAGAVVLSWSLAGQLGPDDYFDVRVWQDGQSANGIANVRQTSYAIGGGFPAGAYNWTVAVVRKQGGKVVTTPAGSTLRFNWVPSGSSGAGGGPPQR